MILHKLNFASLCVLIHVITAKGLIKYIAYCLSPSSVLKYRYSGPATKLCSYVRMK